MRQYLKPLVVTLALIIGAYSASSAQMRIDSGAPGIRNRGGGVIQILLGGGTTPTIEFGGSTSAFPELARDGANLALKKADDSGYSSLLLDDILISGSNAISTTSDAFSFLTGAGTGVGGARMSYVVEANTGTKAPTALESREVYTNTGDGDGSIINLLDDPTVGLSYNVAVTAAQTITINTGTGETIWLAGTSCGTDIAGNDDGASLIIIAVVGGSGGIWHAIGSGTWTC